MSERKTMGELYRTLTREQKRKNNRRFFAMVLKHKGYLVLIFLATTLLVAEGAIVPKLTQLIIDDYLPKVPGLDISNQAMQAIIAIIIGLFGLIIVRATATFISTYILRRFQLALEMELKAMMFRKIQRLEVTYFDKVNEGFFLSRMMRDTSMAAEYARYIPENMINVIFAFTINFTFIFIFSWMLGTVALGIIALLLLYTFTQRKKFTNIWSYVKRKGDNFNQFLVNSFSGIRETKAYSRKQVEINRYDNVARDYQRAWTRNFFLYGGWMTVNTFLLMLLPISMIALGSYQVVGGTLTIGALTALTMYVTQIINPINKFLAIFDLFIRGSVSLSRIFTLLDEREEIYRGQKIAVSAGKIEFKNVHLKYGDGKHALRGVSFVVQPHEKVAFVGHTGSGKSTILKALIKFYNLDKGAILIDDQNIKDVGVDDLRRHLTLMSQEPYLFFDSVKNNVIFGDDSISDDQYLQAIAKSSAAGFVEDLPQKHQTNIGPRGVTLSGGQKQRIALARALLKKSKIILFDEATSALDNKTEAQIRKQLDKITANNTVVYIAHRLTTIQNVDRIFVLDSGKIVEQGSHQELLAKRGKYFELQKSTSI